MANKSPSIRLDAPAPGVEDAERLLKVAYRELRDAKQPVKVRQAAEKGWLAARTAAQAVVACAGQDWQAHKGLVLRAGGVEDNALPHRERVLTKAIVQARSHLHVTAFYAGDEESMDPKDIKNTLDKVRDAMPRARQVCRIHSSRR